MKQVRKSGFEKVEFFRAGFWGRIGAKICVREFRGISGTDYEIGWAVILRHTRVFIVTLCGKNFAVSPRNYSNAEQLKMSWGQACVSAQQLEIKRPG
jgi:hypothetical protein